MTLERMTIHADEALCSQETRPHRLRASVSSGAAACVYLGEMTLAVPGATGFVGPVPCAVIKHEGKYFAAVTAPDVRDHKYGSRLIATKVASSNASPSPA